MDYFSHLDPLLRTFWFIAIPASVFFMIQSVMTFFGGDTFGDADVDVETDTGGDHFSAFQLFSLRNLTHFLLGFGWTGVSFYDSISNHTWLIVLAVIIGIVFVAFFFIIIRQLLKLSEDNSFRIEECVGKQADVYLTIPEAKSGKGQVLISVRGSTRQLEAMTEGDRIESGGIVKVLRIESGILFVEKF